MASRSLVGVAGVLGRRCRPGWSPRSLELLSEEGDGHRTELVAAESAVARARPANNEPAAQANVLESRLPAQSLLLRELRGELRPISSISQDIDNDFSIPYFMIDYLFLTRTQRASE